MNQGSNMTASRRKFMAAIGMGTLAAQMKGNALATALNRTGLKDYYADDFKIGTAIGSDILERNDQALAALVAREFNAITPENCLKWERIRTADEGWNFKEGDKFVEFGLQHKMVIVGHTLAWHSQIPDSVFKNEKGDFISADQLKQKMTHHIGTLVGRYKGKIAAWDAVNEAIDDGLGNRMRKSHYFNIMGEEFIYHAFHVAHEADPQAHLIYNDYNIEQGRKNDACLELLKRMQKKGVPVGGVGIQAHWSLHGPSPEKIEQSILDFAELGLRVHLTELDIDVLPQVWSLPVDTRFDYTPERDPYKNGLPKEIEESLANRWESIFKVLIKQREHIDRVTTWGVSDDVSWLNDFPIKGRTDYPLLFDRKRTPREAYFRLLNLKK
jgi:endo-1,4-beta-xylanase